MKFQKLDKPIRICHIVTSDKSLGGIYCGQHKYFAEHGFEVWGVSSPGLGVERAVKEEGLNFYPIQISRSMDIWGDIKYFIRLLIFLRRQKFDIVETGTAKAGMIGMIAAWLVGVPVRVYTLRGAWYESLKGWRRRVASLTVWIPCSLAHRVFVISKELMEMDIREKVISPDKSCVVYHGSSNGVDIGRFSRNEETCKAAERIRVELKIPKDSFVIGFVGRASVEKGVREIAEAFEKLHYKYKDKLYLLMVGGFDYMGGALSETTVSYLRQHPYIRCINHVKDVQNYYALMDLLVMPSYREGFGNVNIEAAAMGVPVVASDIYGCRESVNNGHTGILVRPKSAEALYNGLIRLIEDKALRAKLSAEGPSWAEKYFDSRKLWQELLMEYLNLYEKNIHTLETI